MRGEGVQRVVKMLIIVIEMFEGKREKNGVLHKHFNAALSLFKHRIYHSVNAVIFSADVRFTFDLSKQCFSR